MDYNILPETENYVEARKRTEAKKIDRTAMYLKLTGNTFTKQETHLQKIVNCDPIIRHGHPLEKDEQKQSGFKAPENRLHMHLSQEQKEFG